MSTNTTKGKKFLLTLFGLIMLAWILLGIFQITFYSKQPAMATFSAPVLYLILMAFTYKGKKWARNALSAYLAFAMAICIVIPLISVVEGTLSEFLLLAVLFFVNGLVVYQLNTNKNIDAYLQKAIKG